MDLEVIGKARPLPLLTVHVVTAFLDARARVGDQKPAGNMAACHC